MANLLEIFKEQSSFGFTGKINLLSSETGQFLGVAYQKDGLIVGSVYKESVGEKALLKMIFDDVESVQQFKLVVEPELVSEEQVSFKMTYEEVKGFAQNNFAHHLSTKKLRPANSLKLVINPEVVVAKDEMTPIEFDVLITMSEWCLVSDIYKNSKLMEHELTNALITLRKKRAIKVFQN